MTPPLLSNRISLLPKAELHLHLDDQIRISADPDRLQQIVWNLVSNAVKFTPRGGRIDVRLQRLDSKAAISVQDTGEGIDPEFLPHVFDPFRQADASKARVHKGLGLGLSIVHNIVRAHDGAITLDFEDEITKGSCVTHDGEIVNERAKQLLAAAR